MRLRTALLTLPLALAACGGSDSAKVYTIQSGTYAVSSATLASPNDGCGLLGAYTDPTKKIGIAVNGTTATFNLANDPAAPANTQPSATINGNSIETPVAANYTVAFGSTCVVRVNRTVVGDITADNATALTLAFQVTTDSGTCDATNTSFAAVPCSSSYHFLATRQ